MEKICPGCFSTHITSREITSAFTPLNGAPFQFQEVVDTCGNCALEGDFERDPKLNNEVRFNDAEHAAHVRDAAHLIDALKGAGIRMAHAERALGLPQRTMFRWKNEGLTAASFTLLKIVAEFPDIIDVLEAGFSPAAKHQFLGKQNQPALQQIPGEP